MINREATIRWKGYNPDDLSLGSGRRVWANCDKCGNGRWVKFQHYRSLCISCAKIGFKHSEETKRKISVLTSKLKTKEVRESVSKFHKDKKDSKETRKKKSESRMGMVFTEEHKENLSKAHSTPEYLNKMSGENHPLWQNGLSFGKYCPKFNKEKREEIRNQYNNCDFVSGLHKDIINKGKTLDVHHVDYNKMQGCDEYRWKLIPLSQSNHRKTNYNRWFWNKLFINALEIDKWYYNDITKASEVMK